MKTYMIDVERNLVYKWNKKEKNYFLHVPMERFKFSSKSIGNFPHRSCGE